MKKNKVKNLTHRKLMLEMINEMGFWARARRSRELIERKRKAQPMTASQKRKFRELKVYFSERPASL